MASFLPQSITALSGLFYIGKYTQQYYPSEERRKVAEAIGTLERIALATAAIFAYKAVFSLTGCLLVIAVSIELSPCSALIFTAYYCGEIGVLNIQTAVQKIALRHFKESFIPGCIAIAALAGAVIELKIIPPVHDNVVPRLLDGFIEKSSNYAASCLVRHQKSQ